MKLNRWWLALLILTPSALLAHDFGEALNAIHRERFLDLTARILAAKAQERIVYNANPSVRLTGPLFKSNQLALHVQRLVDQDIAKSNTPAGHDHAWFEVGMRLWREGKPDEALGAWRRMSAKAAASDRSRARLLQAIYASSQGRKQQAASLFRGLGGAESELGKINELILEPKKTRALVGRNAVDVWTQQVDPALRDRGLITAAVLDMRNKAYDRALHRLNQVRIGGPYANTALLALGWLHYQRKNYARALVPWLELQRRPASDSNVWAALLHLADTWRQLGDERQAMVTYYFALETYRRQIAVLDHAEKALRGGGLFKAMREKHLGEGSPKPSASILPEIYPPDREDIWYISGLVSNHAYNEGYRNFRRLGFLMQVVDHWKEDLKAFNEILNQGPEEYAESLVQQLKYIQRNQRIGFSDVTFEWVFERPKTSRDELILVDGRERTLLGYRDSRMLGGKTRMRAGLARWFGASNGSLDGVEAGMLEQAKGSIAPIYGRHRSDLAELETRTLALRAELDLAMKKELRFLGDLAARHFVEQRHELERYLLRAANEIDGLRDAVGRRKGAY